MRFDAEIVSILGDLPMQLKSKVVEDYEILGSISARLKEQKFDPEKLDVEVLLHSIIQNIIHPLKDLQFTYDELKKISGNLSIKGLEFKDLDFRFGEEEYRDTKDIIAAFEKMLETNGIDIMRQFRE